MVIREQFEQKTLLLTGVTGFVGKCVLEALLRNCNVKKIYCLIRPKRGKATAERFEKLLNGAIFERLKSLKPTELEKVAFVEGSLDADGPQLGISDQDVKTLKAELQLVLHIGGAIRFDLPVREAFATNTFSALNLMRLAKSCPAMRCFLYCSTAYTCPPGQYTEGPPPVPAFVETVADPSDFSDDDFQALVDLYPNTYSLSKSMTEHFLWKQHGDLDVVVAKPAIVMPALRDPYPGWVTELISYPL
jgi:fatty acyl-CoA reductase